MRRNVGDLVDAQDAGRLADEAAAQALERELSAASAVYNGDPEISMVADSMRATSMPQSKRQAIAEALRSMDPYADEIPYEVGGRGIEGLAEALVGPRRESMYNAGMRGIESTQDLLDGPRRTGLYSAGERAAGMPSGAQPITRSPRINETPQPSSEEIFARNDDQNLEELLQGLSATGRGASELGGSVGRGLMGALAGGGAMYGAGELMSPTTALGPTTTAELANISRPVPQVMATEDPIDGVTYTSPQQRDFVRSLIQKGIPRGRAIELSRPDSTPHAHEMQIIRGGSY
jgi:hypothetical protein